MWSKLKNYKIWDQQDGRFYIKATKINKSDPLIISYLNAIFSRWLLFNFLVMNANILFPIGDEIVTMQQDLGTLLHGQETWSM